MRTLILVYKKIMKKKSFKKEMFSYLVFYTMFFIILLGLNAILTAYEISILQRLSCKTDVPELPIQKNGIIYQKTPTVSSYNIFPSNSPWVYTKLFDCECEILIECNGNNLINQTLLGFNWIETNYSGWCSSDVRLGKR